MNKITKIGLTALAGSLVATSAFAGSMSVSGSAKVTYASNGEERSTGAPYSNSKGITFSGSGELDNGFTVSTGYTMSNAAFSSSYVSLIARVSSVNSSVGKFTHQGHISQLGS